MTPTDKLATFLLALILLLVAPFVLLEVLLMLVYRFVISKLAPYFKPELGKLVCTSSAPFASDLVFTQIQKIPLLVTVYLDGHLDVDQFRQRMLKVIDQRDLKTRKHLRPELQQFVTSWCGLLFWQWESNFDVSEHVRLWEEYAFMPTLDEDAILDIGNNLFQKAFEPGTSPWEFLVLHNTRSKDDLSGDLRSTVLFRVHHGLADGFSLLKLVMSDLSGVKIQLARPMRTQRHKSSVLRKLLLPWRHAHDLARTIVCCHDNNPWHIPVSKMVGKVNGGVSNPIDLDFVKNVKNKHGVSFAALLLAAFAGGVKKFMTERGFEFPSQIHCFTVLPFSNHPYSLTNHLTGGLVLLPLKEDSSVKRLAIIHKSLENLKKSTLPVTLFYLIRLAGVQFSWITWKTFSNELSTAVMSNFPGPESRAICLDLPILDGGFAAGFGPGKATLGFSSLSYNGKLRLAAGFDQAVLPESVSCKELLDDIIGELKILDLKT